MRQRTHVEKIDGAPILREKSPSDIRHDKYGREILDPVPMQPPLGYKKQVSLTEQIRQQVLQHHRTLADMEPESIDEADDFDVNDEYGIPVSRWENDYEPSVAELRNKMLAEKRAAVEAAQLQPPAPDQSILEPAPPQGVGGRAIIDSGEAPLPAPQAPKQKAR